VLEHDPRLQGIVWFDEFLNRMLTGDPAREWQGVDDANLTLYMQRVIGIQKIGREVVAQAVQIAAYRNVKNCVRDWLNSRTWDHTGRIEEFFIRHLRRRGHIRTRVQRGATSGSALAARALCARVPGRQHGRARRAPGQGQVVGHADHRRGVVRRAA
jgi:predicted P-loop ATPase